MLKYITLLSAHLFFFSACNSQDQRASQELPSTLDTLYDDYNGTQVRKIRKIFRKGVTYRYHAVYTDQDGKVLTDNYVEIIPTGERWEMQPELQDVASLNFSFTREEMSFCVNNAVNKTYDMAGRWTDSTMEGVIENDREVWMHPIRHNQYIFTEVAPFPEVKLPLEVGKTWKGGIGGLGGWGDWDGMDIMSSYEVIKHEDTVLPFGKLKCWVIEASSSFDLGESTLTLLFNEDYGFVKMDYTNYVGQRLVFEMVQE